MVAGFGLNGEERSNRNPNLLNFWAGANLIVCPLYSCPASSRASFTQGFGTNITEVREFNGQQNFRFPASLDTKTFVTWQQVLLKLAQMVHVFPYKLLKEWGISKRLTTYIF